MANDDDREAVLLARLYIAAVLALTADAAKAERNIPPQDVYRFVQRRECAITFAVSHVMVTANAGSSWRSS